MKNTETKRGNKKMKNERPIKLTTWITRIMVEEEIRKELSDYHWKSIKRYIKRCWNGSNLSWKILQGMDGEWMGTVHRSLIDDIEEWILKTPKQIDEMVKEFEN